MEVTKLVTITTTVTATFAREPVNIALNMHYLNQRNCGVIDEHGKIQLIEHPNMEQLQVAGKRFCPNRSLTISADLMSDGSLTNFKIIGGK